MGLSHDTTLNFTSNIKKKKEWQTERRSIIFTQTC